MKVIIDIPEETIEKMRLLVANGMGTNADRIILNGIPIPDNATNGDVIKALFPNEYDFETDFDEEWWNALYQKGGKE